MVELTLGVIGSSSKENELRLPIHPLHIKAIAPHLRERMVFEQGYGSHFGVSETQLADAVGRVASREETINSTDVVLLPKPTFEDVQQLASGQTLWGWPHCVQDPELTQLSIDERITLIAWEAMFGWLSPDQPGLHTFAKNNEIAGYASVLQALTLTGLSGSYGRPLSAAVIGTGNAGRGSVQALQAMGVSEITVLTNRDVTTVSPPLTGCSLARLDRDGETLSVLGPRQAQSAAAFLGEFDIISNCALQDTDNPMMFVRNDQIDELRTGTLIVDVSCDEAMGFEFARPTTFEDPMFTVENNVRYYAVDHSPSYLWDSATWEISQALLPFVADVMASPKAWDGNETIRRAIEIREGVIQNPKILSFQGRDAQFPHARVR